jgi:hypothetical protein
VGLVCTLSAASSIASGQAGEAEGRAVGDSDAAAMASRIDEILTGLERRGDGVSDIRCQVRLTEEDKVNLTEGIKFGSILFMITEPNPHFLIHFEKSEKDGIVGRQEWFLFDGRWLWEASERQKQVIKRQIVRPAEKLDLFDLERAPFPVPFGQKKETILRNFDVSLSPPEASDPPNTDHLVCIPRPDSAMYRKYERLEFFVNRDLHLPTKIVVTKNEGHEVISAVFPDLSEKSINAQVKREDFAPPAAWRKYKEVVETMDGGAP